MHIKPEWKAAAAKAMYSPNAARFSPVEAILEAVAPLIRDAVLEEAAKVGESWLDAFRHFPVTVRTPQQYASEAVEDVVDAIRALKTKETTNDAQMDQ